MKNLTLFFAIIVCAYSLFASTKVKEADNIGFVDDIVINGREFDEFPHEMEFYFDDLRDNKIKISGILESEDENVPVESLFVEITTDGGKTWSKAKGHSEWEWSFNPEKEKVYEFSLRVVQVVKKTSNKVIETAPLVLKFKHLGKKTIAVEPLKLKFKKTSNKVIETAPLVLKFRHLGKKTIAVEPLKLKFKKTSNKVIEIAPLVLKFKK